MCVIFKEHFRTALRAKHCTNINWWLQNFPQAVSVTTSEWKPNSSLHTHWFIKSVDSQRWSMYNVAEWQAGRHFMICVGSNSNENLANCIFINSTKDLIWYNTKHGAKVQYISTWAEFYIENIKGPIQVIWQCCFHSSLPVLTLNLMIWLDK